MKSETERKGTAVIRVVIAAAFAFTLTLCLPAAAFAEETTSGDTQEQTNMAEPTAGPVQAAPADENKLVAGEDLAQQQNGNEALANVAASESDEPTPAVSTPAPVAETSDVDAETTMPAQETEDDPWLEYFNYETDKDNGQILLLDYKNKNDDTITELEIPATATKDGQKYRVCLGHGLAGLFEGSNYLTSVKLASGTILKDGLGMFFNCPALTTVEASGLVLDESCTTLYLMFRDCISLTEIKGLSTWDTSAVTRMESMFEDCWALENLDVSGWDTSAVTSMESMFAWCESLEEIDVSAWDVSKVVNMHGMFEGSPKLRRVDASNWTPTSCTTMESMFKNCTSLKEVVGIANWDMSTVETIESMFESCESLKALDVSG